MENAQHTPQISGFCEGSHNSEYDTRPIYAGRIFSTDRQHITRPDY